MKANWRKRARKKQSVPLRERYGRKNSAKVKEHLEEASKIFGYSKTEDFNKKFYEIEKSFQDGTLEIISYPRSFESVPILSQYISSSQLGTRN